MYATYRKRQVEICNSYCTFYLDVFVSLYDCYIKHVRLDTLITQIRSNKQ